jgi:hypothetical protein
MKGSRARHASPEGVYSKFILTRENTLKLASRVERQKERRTAPLVINENLHNIAIGPFLINLL